MTQHNQSELWLDIEGVLSKKIKLIGDNEHSYYGYPVELIELLKAYITANYTPNSEVEQQVLKTLKGVWNEAKETEGRTPDSHEAQLIKDIIEEMENARTNL